MPNSSALSLIHQSKKNWIIVPPPNQVLSTRLLLWIEHCFCIFCRPLFRLSSNRFLILLLYISRILHSGGLSTILNIFFIQLHNYSRVKYTDTEFFRNKTKKVQVIVLKLFIFDDKKLHEKYKNMYLKIW